MPALTSSPPTLLLVLALRSAATARPAQEAAALKALGRLLGRADTAPERALGLGNWVAQQLGMPAQVPWAEAWQAFADPRAASADATGACLLLEPVQMVASMNSVAMRPLPLPLSAAQLDALVDLLNPVFSSDGGQVRSVAGRLLLQLAEPADWHTTPLAQCAGRDLRDCLPRGEQAGLLRRWITECQMALHRHAEQGDTLLSGVTGIWAWGEGSLASAAASAPHTEPLAEANVRLFSHDPLLCALAAARQQIGQGDAAEVLRVGPLNGMLVWQGGEDVLALQSVLQPAARALRRGTLASVEVRLWLDDSAMAQGWLLRRHHLLRFWRTPIKPWDAPPTQAAPR